MSEYVRVIATIFVLHLKQVAVDLFVIFTVIIQPLLVALLAIYMLRNTEGFQAIYVIVGSAMTGLWSGTVFFNSHNVQFERWAGTLEAIVGSPTSLATVVVGKSVANTIMSLSSMLFSYPLAAFLFGFQLSVAQPFLFAASLVLTVVALLSVGLVIAPIMAIDPGATHWVNALEFPMFILGGFLFPVLLLPAWTTPLSYALPPYWAARVLHATSSGGATLGEVLMTWALLLGFSVIYWIVAAWLFRVLMRRARQEATLGFQ
jgi:ABC-2 type transport system permease protein